MNRSFGFLEKAILTLLITAAGLAAPLPVSAQQWEPQPEPGTVSGVVRDRDSGGPVAAARVMLAGTSTGVLSRDDGRFTLRNVPAGDHTLAISGVGYGEQLMEGVHVTSGTVTTIADVTLAPAAISLEGIVITPGRFGVMGDDATAPQTMGREMIETMPGLGEDIYRMMHRLPGVAADDYSAKFAVRGGGHEELLVRLDGLTLFEPFHLKDLDGALSIVDVQAIRSVDLTTGGFTAEHGSRLTGVFDMRTLRETTDRTRTSVGLSLTNARLMSAGGFADNRGNWLVSARRGYIDILMNIVDPDGGFTPRYHDVLAKVEYELSPSQVISANVLTAGDAVTMSDDYFSLNSTYGNYYAWINWRAYPGDAVSVQTVLSTGRLDWMRRVEGGEPGTQITELGLDDARDFRFGGVQQDWNWRVSDRHLLKWGGVARSSGATYDYTRSQDGEATVGRPLSRREIRSEIAPKGVEAGAYIAHRVRLAKPLTVETGLRYDRYTQSRESVVSPRANVAFALDRRTTIRGAWGLYHQPQEVYQLQVQDGDSAFYRAERAEHRVLGIDHTLPGGVTLRAEAYQRILSRMRPRYDNLFNVNSGIEEASPDRIRLEPSRGEARGLELFVSNDPRNSLRWHASYTYASVEDVIEGRKVARPIDQRHSAVLELGYTPSSAWSVSTSWQINTGRPYTSSTIATTELPDGRVEYAYDFGAPYGERLEPYHRLDLRVTRRFDVGRHQIAVFADVFNLYNRENARGWSSSLENDGQGSVFLDEGPVTNLPMLPSIGLTWNF